MKVGKPMSKRTTVRLRNKIQKKSAAKQRKIRKDEKKNPQWRSKLKKDPGIPNLFPYKEKLLGEIEESRRRKEAEIQHKKDVARAQRQGKTTVAETSGVNSVHNGAGHIEDEGMVDSGDRMVDEDDEDMDDQEDSNPMAALIASANTRAQAFARQEDDGSEGASHDEEWHGISDSAKTQASAIDSKRLPAKILQDPIGSVTLLLKSAETSQDALHRLMDHYQIPPITTTGHDFATRYLVEVARKRGRLGRGGIPNLHSAALTVLSDLHENRLVLPANTTESLTTGQGEVQIVKTLAEPFRLEGLWNDNQPDTMAVK